MKRFKVLLIWMLLAPVMVFGQHAKPSMSFESIIYDFGEVKEEAGKVTYSFNFTNTGGQPLVIHNVSASCGCTTPEWTKMPIPPGGKGFVKAIFDPLHRPGPFNKTITVSSNAEVPTTVLRITGNVTPKPQTVENQYPRAMGGIRLKQGHIAFTKVVPGTTKTEQLDIINTSEAPVKIGFDGVPAHINIKAVPDVLAPGKTGVIVTSFDASRKNDWGFVVDQVYLVLNNQKDFNNRLSISASIEEDFSKLTTDQLASAPRLEIKQKIFNFGTIKEGQEVSYAFVVTNTGKSNLILRKIHASCGCTAIQPAKTIIAPGESIDVKAIFNSTGKTGQQNKSVTVITNDPVNTTVLLQITGSVTPK